MKLHLPSKLRNALLACMTAMVGITTTCATGALVAGALVVSQAQAENVADTRYWNATTNTANDPKDFTIQNGGKIIIANGTGTGQPADNQWTGNNKYGRPYNYGTIVVEDGGQLYIHIHSEKNDASKVKNLEGSLTLKGNADTELDIVGAKSESDALSNTNDDSRKVQLYFEDGAYCFNDQVNVDGNVYVFNRWGADLTFTNLSSVNDVQVENEDGSFTTISNDKDIITFGMGVMEKKRTITLAYNKDKAADAGDDFKAYSGTIVLVNPYDDNRFDGDKKKQTEEMITLVLSNQNVVGKTAKYVLDLQTALGLGSVGMNVPNLVMGGGNLRNKVVGSQVRQYVTNLDLSEGSGGLLQDGGSTLWTIESVVGHGTLKFNSGGVSYTPSVLYLNHPNITTADKDGYTGTLNVGGPGNYTYGLFQNYVELGHRDALAEATLYLGEGYTNNTQDLCEYTVLALNTPDGDVRIGDLTGSMHSIIMSGRAPLSGTEENPSTNIMPESYAGTRTLYIGSSLDNAADESAFEGQILKNVNVVKEGVGVQEIWNMEDDAARSVLVESGTLEIGSIGQFRRLTVENGALAKVGLTMDSKLNTWGPGSKFYYFEARDNGIDLTDGTKVQGNVVLTDNLYFRPYDADWEDRTIKVVTLNKENYSGDSVTLVGGVNLAVFNPLTGLQADMDNLKTITLKEGSTLASAAPKHFEYLMGDPHITVASDIVINGVNGFIAYGDLVRSTSGKISYSAFNATYTGSIRGENYAHITKDGYGTVTLAGDMTDYKGSFSAADGTLNLSGANGRIKNFTDVNLIPYAKSSLRVIDNAVVTSGTLQSIGHALTGASHKIGDFFIEAGSSFTVTGANKTSLDDVNNPANSYGAATFLISQENHINMVVEGTLTLQRASFLSVVAGNGFTKQLDVNDGGVYNARGLWLQTYANGTAVHTTFNVNSGATLNLGAEGLGHVDVNGKGQLTANDNLLLNIAAGATIGILNDADSWSSVRELKLPGMVTVNTQGYVVEENSTANGSGKVIHLGLTSAQGEGAGITKVGMGILELANSSALNTAVVKEGYLSIGGTGTIVNMKTEDSGSLLFDLTVANSPGSDVAEGQERLTVTNVDGVLNVTVQGTGITLEDPEQGKYFTILDMDPHKAPIDVHLVALVDDGFNAIYRQTGGYGKVQISALDENGNAVKVYGSDDLLLWQTAEGESSFWANSTEANWKAEGSDELRRFTNYSDVEFAGAGEAITILGTVLLNKDTAAEGSMTVSGTGYSFLGEGSIVGENAKMVIENDVTFSNMGLVQLSGGAELKNGATLRLEYLAEDASNWQTPVYGDGVLEIAAGGIRSNVLESVMHTTENVAEISLDNKTTIALTDLNPAEASKLATAERVSVKDGSRISIATGTAVDILEAGDILTLSGDGIIGDKADSEAALSVTPKMWITYNDKREEVQNYQVTDVNVLADVDLAGDTTVYIGNQYTVGILEQSSMVLEGAYNSNGYDLTKAGEGTLTFKKADAADVQNAGAIVLSGGVVDFDLNDVNHANAGAVASVVTNEIKVDESNEERVILQTQGYTSFTGGWDVQSSLYVSDVAGTGVAVDSSVQGSDDVYITMAPNTYLYLNGDNTGYEGTWNMSSDTTMEINHENALVSSVVSGLGYVTTPIVPVLKLGAGADTYKVSGISENVKVRNADTANMKTLEFCNVGVSESTGDIGCNVSVLQSGRGAQRYIGPKSFEDGYNGDITVQRGMLQFAYAPETYGTISLDGADGQLSFGYFDYEYSNGNFLATNLQVKDGQVLNVSEVGSELNANLLPRQNGQITLGSEKSAWTPNKGLSLYGQELSLDTTSKAALTIHLSAFQEAGDYIELFTEIGKLSINGTNTLLGTELGLLGDYFLCDDINLEMAPVMITDAGAFRIQLTNDSDGQYYAWEGGDGEWNTSSLVWATKDDVAGKYKYEQAGAAYFTGDVDAEVQVVEDIVAREMAVKNGSYEFKLVDGNDLTINSKYYEMEGGKATFELSSGSTTDAAGNEVPDGAILTVGGGFGDIANTEVTNVDGSDLNRLILGGTTSMSDKAAFKGVDIFLNGTDSQLNLGDTKATELIALNGEGTVTADGGEMTISNKKDGVFVGSLLAADAQNITPGANKLTIEFGKKQIFSDVTSDESWNLVNNGALDLKLTENSKLNSLTLGADSVTTLTANTDKEQLLGLTQLIVEDRAKLTLNSTGNAPIMSGPDTPGTSYTVLGSFSDDEQLVLAGGDGPLKIEIGTGSAFLMVDKTKPITLEAVYNDSTGYYDLVMKATVDDTNQFTPIVEGESNATAGAEMLWSAESMAHMAAEPDGDMAQAFNAVANMATSADVDKGEISKALAAVAGSSTAVLGSAFSADVERQLKAIRNRTTTMGVNQCEVNENMPYYNAWINAEGNHRELDADGLAAGYTHDSWGGTVGFDVDVTPSVTMGLALTAMYGDIESDGPDKAEGDFDTMYLSAFARYARNAWVHTFVATVGRADVTLDRTVNVGGYNYKTTGDTDGMAFGFMYEVGRVFAANEEGTTCWQPVFNVALRNSSISGYEEEGSDAALTVGDQDFTTITFGLGARMQTIMGENLYNRTSIFEARALLKFDVGDTEAETTTAMINGDGKAHAIEGAEVGEIGVELGAGVTIPVGAEGGSIFVDASAELRSGYTNINGTVGYRVNF